MPYRWIVSDIDGCLSPEESEPWNLDRFFEFARLCQSANAGRGPIPPVTLCTGRPQPYVEVLMKLLGVTVPAICENGAVLYTLDDNHAQYGPGVTPEGVAGLRAVRAFVEMELVANEPRAVMQFGKEAQFSVFSQHPEIFPAMQASIERFLEQRPSPGLDITASHYYLNVSLAGVTKGRALAHLLDRLGVDKSEAAGIGDTEGDLPLREAVGFFACPANAQPVIRDAADYVSPYPTLEGVLDILARPELQL